ncbi:MAG: exonuclease subunit SbcD [Clostridiales bacterium]|nr:exonuclease subunit SbcD [Clostridiales bacterium]
MQILHTSDWHVGKRLMGRERLAEQAEMLDEIADVCDREGIELVLLAGDVFDTYTPSADAEELFYSKIKKIAGKHRAVLIISGNHDDGVRLSSIAPFAEEQGVYVVGNARTAVAVQPTNRRTRPTKSGKGYVVFENELGERVFVSMLPYPNEARFKEEKSELSYVERMQGWIAEGESGNTEQLPSIFMAHVFVAGGSVSEGEREIDLGGARAVPLSALPKSDYIALGHLHKKQKMGAGHCYYSGSPLQYSFDERPDKSVKVFRLTTAGVTDIKDVPLHSGRKLCRLKAATVADGERLLDEYPNALIELTLTLSAPLAKADSLRLYARENLVSLLTEIHADGNLVFESRKGLSDEALFDAYYKSAYNAEPKKEVKTLFLETLATLNET